MKTFYDDINDYHKNSVLTMYNDHYFKDKWVEGVSLLYYFYHTSYFPTLIKGHSLISGELTEAKIDRELHYLHNTDNPIFYVCEYNENRTSCRLNVFDQLALNYSSFEVDLTTFPKEEITGFLEKKEAATFLDKQLFTISNNDVVEYLVKTYNFKFDSTSINEQLFDSLL